MSLPGSNFETTNEVIIDWVDVKLREVCRIVGVFMNYLLLHRNGYKTFSTPPLTLPIVRYVVEELFNCARVSDMSIREVYPEDFSIKTRRLLREDSLYEIEIGSEIIEYLWKYISYGVSNLTEGLDFANELSRLKTNIKRSYSMTTLKEIQEMKRKIDSGDENALQNMAIKTLVAYRHLKKVIKKELDSVAYHLINFKTNPSYVAEGMGVILDDKDKATLIEFGAHKKRVNRLKSIDESLKEKKSLVNSGKIGHDQYRVECKELLTRQDETLHRINKDLKRSDIGKFLGNKKKNILPPERTGKRDLLDRIISTSITSADKWKRASLSRIFVEDADYDIKKRPPPKELHESSEKWIRGDEDMGSKDLKLTQDMIDEEYTAFNNRRVWKEFLQTAHDQLRKKINEVEDDEDLTRLVQQRITNKIKTRIKTYQLHVSMRECDHNFDDNIDNCILQSLIYLSVSVSDWLETSKIGIDEFQTVLEILLPEGLQEQIKSSSQKDERFTVPFVTNMKKYNIEVDQTKMGIIISTIKKIKSLKPDDENFIAFNNRVRYFANSLF